MADALSNYLIPLQNVPQQFVIDLGGTTYTMTNKWNDMAQSWYCDIADQDQNPIACGIPFITGADLLSGLQYLGFDGALIVYTNGMPSEVPTLDSLGGDSNLYFQSSAVNNG